MGREISKSESQGKPDGKGPRIFRVDAERIAEGLSEAGFMGLDKDSLATMFEDLGETVEEARSKRANVVMVRVRRDSLDRLDELVECGLARSRSEAAAFLIAEGVKARKDLFDKLAEQTRIIREAKDRLKEMLKDEELPRKQGSGAAVIIADAEQIK